jgi:DNA-binding Lrp family transcriptional regulator
MCSAVTPSFSEVHIMPTSRARPTLASSRLDDLDARLIGLLRSGPRRAEVEMARLLGVARGTVRARLERLERDGVIAGYGPDLDPAALGLTVLAFTALSIDQGLDASIHRDLAAVPEVLEVHAVTGAADLHCRIVARTNEHLHDVIQRILRIPGIARAETQLALHPLIERGLADVMGVRPR